LYDKFSFVFDEPDDVKEILAGDAGALIFRCSLLETGRWEHHTFGKYSKKMNVVMMDVEYRNIKSILESQNKLSAFSVIPVAEDSLDHVFMIKDAIARGEYVAMQGDRLTPNGKSAQALFLGEQALFPLGPFVLASRTEAPVIFYYAIREGFKKYKFVFRLFKPDEFSRRRGGEMIILHSYVNELESVVKSAPEQWYNFYKFWL